ncbi:MAG: nickel-dependent lactate racemase, partial [bacterium]
MAAKVGRAALEKLQWRNHDCRDKNTLAYLGRTRRGTKVFINKAVAEADLVLLIGSIEPHLHAGFGGGCKNILPGVAGLETISQNHALCAHPKYFSAVGLEPDKNPMRQDIEEGAQMIRGVTFIVNTVLNHDLKVIKIVAGDPIAAHREGMKVTREIYGVRIPAQADVVITDSYPMDLDLRQGAKAIGNTHFAAKPGGIIIAALKCDDGLGESGFAKARLPSSPLMVNLLAKVLAPLIKSLPLGISPEDRFSVYTALKTIQRNRIFACAPSIADEMSRRGSLFRIFKSMPDAVAEAEEIKPEATVLIFPMGGVTYPIVGSR